jgi:hypothetical protein
MERIFPMTMRSAALFICALVVAFAGTSTGVAGEPSRLALVASTESATQKFTPAQLRKVFLGLEDKHAGNSVRPLRNMSDRRLYDVFLQKVVFMSARNYERLLLSRVINMGGRRPPIYSSQKNLVQALRADPFAVSYMWETTAKNTPGIKILQPLW